MISHLAALAKCKIMRIGNSAPFSYSMLEISTSSPLEIAEVEEMKDFGVWCTNDLKPSLQCQKAAGKAVQILGLLRRSFQLFSVFKLSFLYKMYVCQTPPGILYPGLEPVFSKRY